MLFVAISTLTQDTVDAFKQLGQFAGSLVQPRVRLGVTGLARSGKTVFTTALVHNLIAGARLPFFDAAAEARITRAYLEPQPDDQVPRFAFESHLEALTADQPYWPESTRQISQLRLTLEYEPRSFWKRQLGYDRLHVDIVDYPGEWLLDLPLLNLDYAQWSADMTERSARPDNRAEAKAWRKALAEADPEAPADEAKASHLADLFKAYLGMLRADPYALSTLPPGRFLMPSDLEGSPALTFAPLDGGGQARFASGSLWAMMARRFEAYKAHVVRPFFRDHFARLDRQIVLIDVLAALNGGPLAVSELERAMRDVLDCFRMGANSLWSNLFAPRIDRIVFAAAKADHVHQSSHDRLEAILKALAAKAIERAEFAGADLKTLALAAVRATREGEAKHHGELLPCIIGKPLAGEKIGQRVFNGEEPFAIFPGDLPADPEQALKHGQIEPDDVRFVRFRPPDPVPAAGGGFAPFPNIRLDRAIQALIGDYLQ